MSIQGRTVFLDEILHDNNDPAIFDNNEKWREVI